MKMTIDVDMDYAVQDANPALLAITVARTQGQEVLTSQLDANAATLRWIEGEGGIGERIWALAADGRLVLRYHADVEITRPPVDLRSLAPTPWHSLPGAALSFLRPSRFCPSDLFVAFVESEFGDLQGGAKIAAIADWAGASLAYVPGSSTATTTAVDTFVQRQGVCRDYAHLVVSLARAANIPARYTTGYGAGVKPQDFHAVAEVWLAGGWHIVDATGMSCESDLAIIGSGHDASDVAFMETEKWANFMYQSIRVTGH